MSPGTFAAWVEPLALRLAQSRREIAKVVSEVSADAWNNAGWSYKDHLSHLPESHRGVQAVLQAFVDGRDPDFSRFDRINDINEENRQKHLATPVKELLTATEESEKTESILSDLSAEQADLRLGPMTLSQAIHGFSMHDDAHIEEIRKALS